MTVKKIKKFVKEHAKAIGVGAALTSVGVVGVLLRKNVENVKLVDIKENLKLPMPSKSVGSWKDFYINSNTSVPTAVVHDVPIQYFGDFGAEIVDHCHDHNIEEIVFDTHVNLILEFTNR